MQHISTQCFDAVGGHMWM